MKPPSANERRLSPMFEAHAPECSCDGELYACACGVSVLTIAGWAKHAAHAFARRGVLAVCTATVPNRKLFTMRPGQNPEQWPRDADSERVWGKRERAHLRRLAKGVK